MRFSKRFGIMFFIWLFLAAMPISVFAEETEQQIAEDISSQTLITSQEGFYWSSGLFDGDMTEHTIFQNDSWVTLSEEGGIGALYFIFDVEYPSVTLVDAQTGEQRVVDLQGMVHKYIDLTEHFGEPLSSVTVCFDSGDVMLNELRVFGPGEAPSWVQRWDTPADDMADLVLFSTHGDDEQLFFAGILPFYAGELEMDVQVVYLTNHREHTYVRVHEMLNGLWAVGVRHYPVFGTFPDFRLPSMQDTINVYSNMGHSQNEMLGFVVEQLRRFKPNVAVGHDLNGEYGHGMHMLYAHLLTQACQISADPEQYPETAERYGVWDVPKTYLHLYEENGIVLNWDFPLSKFGGMTPYEVTRDLGYTCHESQYDDFSWYYEGYDTAAEVPLYSPCLYGLYRSTVGEDVEKNSFFENVGWMEPAESALAEEELPEPEPEETISEQQPEEAAAPPETVETAAPQAETGQRNPLLTGLCISAVCLAAVLTAVIWKEKNKKS